MSKIVDPFTLNQWYAVRTENKNGPDRTHRTRLLGVDIICQDDENGQVSIRRLDRTESQDSELPSRKRYGLVWTSLGMPESGIFEMPETEEEGRRHFVWDAVTVKTSGLRAIENFLDLAHFPYVHSGILGEEPLTEVTDYQVERINNEIWVKDCSFHQPKAAAIAEEGIHVNYIYRVPHPFVSILYKTCPLFPEKFDVIALMVLPREEDVCDIYTTASLFDNVNTDVEILHFQQKIFLQDRLILENQVPKLLPLGGRSEVSVRADAASIAYRRWLLDNGLSYGACTG
ncbi:MAG: aromatic ring-hydroxylating dioxygenase subunit alpha [SAR324 cluster bacterium]|nr:aromatic ring-hydroxylating dioxygenase subunit alpha [SAR324 cluster bacterium]